MNDGAAFLVDYVLGDTPVRQWVLSMLNLPLANVFESLQVNFGSAYVNDFNILGRTFQVRAQADSPFRAQPEQITQLKARNSFGGMVPLGSVVNMHWRSDP